MRGIAPAILCLALAACVGQERVNVFHPVCLPMKEYTQAQQSEAARELAAPPEKPQLGTMMTDYGQMRAADRGCIAATGK